MKEIVFNSIFMTTTTQLKIVELDVPVEVSARQYNLIMSQYGMVCFGRAENEKFFIKLALEKYQPMIQKIVNSDL
jgi:hypothetical protein